MKKHKLVYIRWCDAIQNVDSWQELDMVEKWADYSDWEVESVGWLIKETKEYLVLSSKKEKDHDGIERFGLLLKLPKTWIRERKDL